MTRARDLADLGGNAATLEKQGLTLIKTESFSGVTTVNIDNVFSATYDHYKTLLWWKGASASGAVTFRYRVGGADNSTSNYARQYLIGASTSIFAARQDSATSISLDTLHPNTTYRQSDIFNPFKTEFTTAISTQYYRADQNQNSEISVVGNIFQATTSFTGFSILSSGANISGQLQVFGYNL
jgi:hypothetical protein